MKPNDRNVIMWSWCGQVSSATEEIIARDYLGQMNQLELDYPNVNFIYMTGHLDSTGSLGNLHQRNEQIRAYARANNKILYDFADIERFDPLAADYLNLGAGINADGCLYSGGNWCVSWCSTHTCPTCVSCAHSHCFNCYQKGKALWVMLAQIAGWDPSGSIPDPTLTPMPSDYDSDGDTDYLDLTSLINSFNQIFRNELISIFSFNHLVGNL
jgi:hypothetical protein